MFCCYYVKFNSKSGLTCLSPVKKFEKKSITKRYKPSAPQQSNKVNRRLDNRTVTKVRS